MSVPGDSTGMSPSSDDAPEAEPPERLAVTIVEEGGDWSVFGPLEAPIRAAATALASHRDLSLADGSEASIVLGSDRMLQRLNLTYRGKDAPTNVLSFPYQPPPGAVAADSAYLGDVVLAAETLAMEASERGIEPVHHLQHLIVHGLLHLLGHDHQSDAEAEAMERLETEILAIVGVADPHAASAAI
jgi:probable rRNA maturation factor